jgi:hypothetical protein
LIIVEWSNEKKWLNQKRCISVKQPIVALFMIQTGGTGRAKLKKGFNLKTCPKTGNVRFAVPLPRHLNALGRLFQNLNEKENAMKWLQFLTPVQSIDFKETQDMIASARSDEIIILDVRQPNEYKQSHIPGATLIPLPELSNRLGESDPQKPVLIY